MEYSVFELIKEAHSHGRECVKLWDSKKSFNEFLKQYNLVEEFNLWEHKKDKHTHPALAKSLKAKGYTIRAIAKLLGYKHPGSITHLLIIKKV